MNHAILIIAFVTLSSPMIAMQSYKLPDKVALERRLASITPHDFEKTTQLIQKLADQDRTARDVAAAVAAALLTYGKHQATMSGPMKDLEMLWLSTARPLLAQTIMQDHPAAINDLHSIEAALPPQIKRLSSSNNLCTN